MAYSHFVEMDLEDARLLDCYLHHKEVWGLLALAACHFAYECLGTPPRQDDVVELLIPGLKVNRMWRTCLGRSGVEGEIWYRYFAECIVHHEWPELLRTME